MAERRHHRARLYSRRLPPRQRAAVHDPGGRLRLLRLRPLAGQREHELHEGHNHHQEHLSRRRLEVLARGRLGCGVIRGPNVSNLAPFVSKSADRAQSCFVKSSN